MWNFIQNQMLGMAWLKSFVSFLLLKLGIELPFMVDLSLKLMFYEIVDNMYLKEEDLVNSLWK